MSKLKQESKCRKFIFIFFILGILSALVGCTNDQNSKITGAAAVIEEDNLNLENLQDEKQEGLEKEKLFLEQTSMDINNPIIETQTNNELDTNEKKKEVLSLIESSYIDKIKISILLNDIDDIGMINAWNKLQRCIDCNEYGSLKQDFIRATEESISKDS